MKDYNDYLFALEEEMKKYPASLEKANNLLGGMFFYAEEEELRVALQKAKEISCHEGWQEEENERRLYYKDLLGNVLPSLMNADSEIRVSAAEIVADVLLKSAELWRADLSIDHLYS